MSWLTYLARRQCRVEVFIRMSAGRSGATKVQLAERRDGRSVIIQHGASARSEVEFAVLMVEARRRLRAGQGAPDLTLPEHAVDDRPGIITATRSALLWRVLTTVYERLGFDVVEATLQRRELARIIKPTSKVAAVCVLDETGICIPLRPRSD